MSAGRILVVDDDSQIRRVMRATLTARGYEVNDARSGEAALDRLREQAYDLVLLDMNMPGVDGLETCRAIRAGSEVPLIMLTVRNTEQDKVDALDAGADDYITKPFGTPELLARIRAALRRAPLAAIDSRQIRFGDIEMDVAARRVVVRGKPVRLTPKEFSLLLYFATHPNQVLSHRELLQAVWGPDYGDESQYLRVFVNQLRKKIESDPARPQYLLTEAWLGYRLEAPG
ncbi:MAG TPA: response regulator transcription factor [Terriglobia bacterium]|nr:response regulator transcription factor [Terriglobia bacterium]